MAGFLRRLRSCLAGRGFLERPVQRGPADAEHLRHLGDGVLAAAVGGLLAGEPPREPYLVGRHGPGTSARAAPGAGGAEPLMGALHDELALELVDRAEDMADQPPSRRGRADVLRVQCSTGSRTVSERVPQRYRFLRKL